MRCASVLLAVFFSIVLGAAGSRAGSQVPPPPAACPAGPDTDVDDLPDCAEARDGTDPADSDSDDDGVLDGDERLRVRSESFSGIDLGDAQSFAEMKLADMDGDQDLDVVIGHQWFASPGDGSGIGAAVAIPSPWGTFYLGDVDDEGDLDLYVLWSEVLEYAGEGDLTDTVRWGVTWKESMNGGASFVAHEVAGYVYDEDGAPSPTRSAALLDLDADGDLDFVAYGERSTGLDQHWAQMAWHENAPGGPGAANDFGPNESSGRVILALHPFDVDGDTDDDLVALVGVGASNELDWYENTGSGLTGPNSIATAVDLEVVAPADLDGDGRIDLLVQTPTSAAWYPNDSTGGVGSFAALTLLTGISTGQDIVPLDIDGDGDLDFLVEQIGDDYEWVENQGGLSSFAAPRALGDDLARIATGDYDGDADLDLVARNSVTSSWLFYRNPGTGPLDSDSDDDGLSDGDEVTHGTHPLDPDADDDGLLDGDEIALGADPFDPDSDTDGLSDGDEVNTHGTDPTDSDSEDDGIGDRDEIVFGLDPNLDDADGDPDADGLGNLAEITIHSTHPQDPDSDEDGLSDGDEIALGTNPIQLDSDQDGLRDGFEVAHGFDPLLAGEQALDPDFDLLINLGEQGAATNPFDADSDDDGLTDYEEVTRVRALGFGPKTPIYSGLSGARNIDVADVDGNGELDVVAGEQVCMNPVSEGVDGDCTQIYPDLTATWGNAIWGRFADLDKDLDFDVLGYQCEPDFWGGCDNNSNRTAFYSERTPSGWEYRPMPDTSTFRIPVAADVDSDGDDDILDPLTWRANLGLGDFGPNQTFSLKQSELVEAADVDGDGDVDALAGVYGFLDWRENDGAGAWPRHIIELNLPTVRSFDAADFDLDTDLDIVAAYGIYVAFYENLGTGTFAPAVLLPTSGQHFEHLVAADVDGDGDPDVVAGSDSVGDVLGWYENMAPGAFGSLTTIDAGGALAVGVSDLDGDGNPEVQGAKANGTPGVFYFPNPGTDPLDPDSDGDGVVDGKEVALGSDPRDAGSIPVPEPSAWLSMLAGITLLGLLARSRVC